MRLHLYFLIIYTLFQANAFSEECKADFIKEKKDMLADDWLGLKCDPLDKSTWLPSWNSPCDCLKKGEKFTRIKEALFKKNREKRSASIQTLLEKKVAEVIRSQIDSGFDQSLRLDTLLKQGSLNLSKKEQVENFPANCRAGKIGEVIALLVEDKSCSKEVYNKRLALFLNGKKDFKEYLASKMDTFANASMNRLSKNDIQGNMCIPYKSFQSLNNHNPLRKTYLTLAKSLHSFKEFQDWASNRKNPEDTRDKIASYNKNKEAALMMKGAAATGLKGLGFNGSYVNSGMSKRFESFRLEFDYEKEIQSIDRDQILHLVKTDPVFERMIKDPKFFEYIKNLKSEPEAFKENDPALLGELMKSQNEQCKSLYGQEESRPAKNQAGIFNPKAGNINQVAKPQVEQNILTQFLCNEDFPKKFLNNDTIKNILAPELKEEAEIKGLKHTEAIIAKWAYCSGDKVVNYPDNSFAIELGLDESGKSEELQPLHRFLNLSLNPKSDLETSKDNKYKNFNDTVCKFVPDNCKNPDPAVVDFKCSTSSIAEEIISKMVSDNTLGKKKASELHEMINNNSMSDKELKEKLQETRKFSVDQITSLILLRNQTTAAKKHRALDDLKRALGLDIDQNIDQYIKDNGGLKAVMANAKVSDEIIRQIGDASNNFAKDNIYGESIESKNSSYFSNYYALAEKTDESNIRSSSSVIAVQPNVPGQTSRVPGSTDSPPVVSTTPKEAEPIYTRRTFGDKPSAFVPPVVSGPPAIAKPEPIVAEKKSEPIAKKTDDIPKAEVTPDVAREEQSEPNVNSNPNPVTQGGGSSFTLTSGSSSSRSKSSKDNDPRSAEELAKLDELAKLENQLSDLDKEYKGLKNTDSDSSSSERDDSMQKLKETIEQMKRQNTANRYSTNNSSNAMGGRRSSSSNFNNDFSNNNSGFGGSSNNSFGNKNYVNPKDPFERGKTGRREIAENQKTEEAAASPGPVEAEKVANAAGASSSGAKEKDGKGKGKSLGLSAGASGEDSSDVEGSLGTRLKNKRYPASETGEDDPDDTCGYVQEMNCYFEHATIEFLSRDLSIFVLNLELQGRSFRAVEHFKYKDKTKPSRYFIHVYEPDTNLSAEDKAKLFAKAKKLHASAKTKENLKELWAMAKKVKVVEKIEITKDDMKKLSKQILLLSDLNKMSLRRARKK